MKKGPGISNPVGLIGLSIFFIIIGGMAIDPVLSLSSFLISGIVAIWAIIKGKKWVKIIALIILVLSIAFSISAFTKAKDHMNTYKKRIEGKKI